MDNWKQSLDKYLTTEPEDGFTQWCEEVDDEFSDEFYNSNENWIYDRNSECNDWLNKLFDKNKTPVEASVIIERAFRYHSRRKYTKPLDTGIDSIDDDVYTVKEFMEHVKCGGINDNNGVGYWVKDGMKSRHEVFSTPPLDATHVVWYNK